MKFKIQKDVFLRALKCLPSLYNNINPVINSIMLCADDKLYIKAKTNKIITQVNLDAEIIEKGALCVPATDFINMVAKMPEELLEISEKKDSDDKTRTCIKTKGIKFLIKNYKTDRYPVDVKLESKQLLKISSKKLAHMIEKTSFSAGLSSGHTVDGILFEISKDNLSLTSSDGKRLSKINTVDKDCVKLVVSIIFIKELYKIIKDLDEDVILSLGDSDNIIAELEKVKVVGEVLSKKFPEYEKSLEIKANKKVTVNRLALLEALNRANVLRVDTLDDPVVLDITSSEFKIFKSKEEESSIVETVNADCSDTLKVGVKFQYLNDLLTSLTEDNITLMFSDDVNIVVYKEENYTHLIMPIVLGE